MSRPIVAIRLFVAAILVHRWSPGVAVRARASGQRARIPRSAAAAATTAAAAAADATPDPPAPSLGEPPAAIPGGRRRRPGRGLARVLHLGRRRLGQPVATGRTDRGRGPVSRSPSTLADGVPVNDWTAKRVPAGTTDGSGAVAIGDGAAPPITFTAPAPGAWSVQVVVTFGDDLGSAAYYWAVTVR